MRKNRVLIMIILILAVTGSYLVLAEDEIHRALMNELSMKCMIPRGSDAVSRKKETIIYVLGSTQERLKYHFQTAAALYNGRVAERIFILSRPGITEYSPTLRRNLTNDEWAARELVSLGVPAGNVEAVPVPSGFFGTFSEGRRISRLGRERGYRRLVLVSSPHHTRRVHLTFSHFLGGEMAIYVCGASDPASLFNLLAEYVKYTWYRWVLIPVSSISVHSRTGIPSSQSQVFHRGNAENIPDRVCGAAWAVPWY